MRVLVVEDNAEVARQLKDTLERELFVVDVAGDGEKGWFMGDTEAYDAVILDLGLPKLDGLTVLQRWRQGANHVPVLILTSRDTWREKVAGLRAGADDYLVKPFEMEELLARVEAVLRRSPQRPTDVSHLEIPGGRIDLARREVCFEEGHREELSEREVELVRYLAVNRGRAIARDELLQNVWRISPQGINTRTIDMHVARLREKLEESPEKPTVILTVRGKGYMLAGE